MFPIRYSRVMLRFPKITPPKPIIHPGTIFTRETAKKRQKFDTVYLSIIQAGIVVENLLETARKRNWRILRGAVMCNHIHLVITDCPDDGPRSKKNSKRKRASRTYSISRTCQALVDERRQQSISSFGRRNSSLYSIRGGTKREIGGDNRHGSVAVKIQRAAGFIPALRLESLAKRSAGINPAARWISQ